MERHKRIFKESRDWKSPEGRAFIKQFINDTIPIFNASREVPQLAPIDIIDRKFTEEDVVLKVEDLRNACQNFLNKYGNG